MTETRWAVDMICCGHDDGTFIRDTWEEANALREGYLKNGEPMVAGQAGHERSAILRKAKRGEQQSVPTGSFAGRRF